ncbi:Ger(x)C family spore germination protein [Paenibacillus sp.]|uniref:Ger(x)C family spore germination protein n=1 Tax=Paenibacillus sp. TaxID=58172 RepID=UPI00281244E9|nr:Ger(x)C family spore germination protein [Paenibacillus sp.]
MNRKPLLLALLLSAMLLQAGCWNYRELNELAIVSAMGVDKTSRGEYRASVQIINAREIAGRKATGNAMPVTVYAATGRTLFEAIRKTGNIVPRRINVQHMRDFVIGEELAREGVKDIFDLMERDHEMRLTTRVFIARGTSAESILGTLTAIESIPAIALLGKLKVSGGVMGEHFETKVDDVIRRLQVKGGGPVISGVMLVGDESMSEVKANVERTALPAVLMINGMGLFREGQLVGWIKGDPAKGLTWISNKMKSSIVVLDCEKREGKVAIEILRSSTVVEAKVRNDKPSVDIAVREVGNVGEAMCPIDLNKSAEIRELEKQWSDATERAILAAVKEAMKLKTDTLGFGEAVERADPKAWKRMERDWGRIFPTCDVTVRVEASIQRTGMRTSPFFFKQK